MTLLVENFGFPDGETDVGFAQLRAPVDRAATLGPGRVTPGSISVPIAAGLLSVTVEPGPLYVRIVLQRTAYPEALVTIPATGTVRLSDLLAAAPVVAPPAAPRTYPSTTTYPSPTLYPIGA